MSLPDSPDQYALTTAVDALENPNFIVELANWVGKPVDASMKRLPPQVALKINAITTKALQRALSAALSTLGLQNRGAPSKWLHQGAVAVSGGVGGAFGVAGAAIEIPVSTTVMLRSIADIARAEGEDLRDVETRLACIEVFALGGRSPTDDTSESVYFLTRAALAGAVGKAATFVAERGMAERGAPALVQLVAAISKRFAPVIAEKFAAESIPVIGAIGGATINVIFMNHFQRMAQGHFTVRRLERKHGQERVRAEYDDILAALSKQKGEKPGARRGL